jgi:putative protein-disulfide isomerase
MEKRLIYIFDALCGWCFGFSPVMQKVADAYPDVPIEVISGGLMLGDRVGPIGEVAPYVKTAYKDVENRTGVQFGEAFIKGGLADGTLRLNSLPPAIAMVIFKEQFPQKAIQFAHALHHIIYVNGHSSEDYLSMSKYAADLGFDKELFLERLHVESYEDLAKQDFMHAQQLQATGFPQLIAQASDGQLYLVARGYTSLEDVLARLQRIWLNR